MNKKIACIVSGMAAGAVNGFFGTGGGMVLVPAFLYFVKMDEKKAMATSVAVIAPLCVISIIFYVTHNNLNFGTVWPYLAGGLAGGIASGFMFKKINACVLRRIFGALIVYGGIKALLL